MRSRLHPLKCATLLSMPPTLTLFASLPELFTAKSTIDIPTFRPLLTLCLPCLPHSCQPLKAKVALPL